MNHGRPVIIASLLSGLLLLVACGVRLTVPEDFPKASKVYDVVPYKQEPRLCGPYALAAVLDFLGVESDPEEMAERIYSPGAGGTLTMDLVLESGRRGVEAKQVKGTLESLHQELENGLPAIALLRYPGTGGTPGHFVVVTGHSMQPRGFFLLWGDGRLSWMDDDRFKGFWSGSGFWVLLFDQGDRT
jgi:hypothetical protein